jgi:hypothetical protein
VFGLVRNGSSADAIADYLGQITSETMGLSGKARQHDLKVAAILINWKQALDEEFS